jgi:hypothetical protein
MAMVGHRKPGRWRQHGDGGPVAPTIHWQVLQSYMDAGDEERFVAVVRSRSDALSCLRT